MDAYTTFSGIDITALFDNLARSTTQAAMDITHTTDEFGVIIKRDITNGTPLVLTRERVPVYTFGQANAEDLKRGREAAKEPIGFTLFDRDAFHSLFLDNSDFYYKHMEELGHSCNRT